jgi:hypothetical protein
LAFKLKNARDLSWASSAFILDVLKSIYQSLALSAYPVESDGNDAWDVLQNILKFD